MKLPIGTSVYKITRIRNVVREDGDFPIAIEYSYIPEALADKLLQYNLEENSLFENFENTIWKSSEKRRSDY